MALIVEFAESWLEALYYDPSASRPHLGKDVVRAYRKVVGLLFAAVDDRDLRALKSLHLEQLQGKRKGQSSLRINRSNRLIVQFRTDPRGRVVAVIEIIDHDHY